jgi:hypothetical protein
MAIILTPPRDIHVCVACSLPITLEGKLVVIRKSRRDPTPVAAFWTHPTVADCQADRDLRRTDNPYDVLAQYARLLDAELLRRSKETPACQPA